MLSCRYVASLRTTIASTLAAKVAPPNKAWSAACYQHCISCVIVNLHRITSHHVMQDGPDLLADPGDVQQHVT